MARINYNSKIKSELRIVDTIGLKNGEYEFPDFLIIGPQRTGTTWLYINLISHPEIYMPTDKELFFFNYLKIKKSKGNNYKSNRLEWYSEQFTPTFLKFFKTNLLLFRKYKSSKRCNINLLKYYSPKVKGEATASYALMDTDLIQEIVTINPEIKIIMMLRHPIERSWSHAKKDLLKLQNKTLEQVSFDEFKTFYSTDYMINCGKYSEIIPKWNKYIKNNNLFIGHFLDIPNNPTKLLKDLYKFLNVDLLKYDRLSDKQKLKDMNPNPTIKLSVPSEHKIYLQKIFSDEIKIMNKEFDLNW